MPSGSYAVLIPPPAADFSGAAFLVAAQLERLGVRWRFVSHPLAADPDEGLCVSLSYPRDMSMVVRARRVLAGGVGVAWGGRMTANVPVVHVSGHVENLTREHLAAHEDVDLGWNADTPLAPILPECYRTGVTGALVINAGHGCYYGRCRYCATAQSQSRTCPPLEPRCGSTTCYGCYAVNPWRELFQRDPEVVAEVVLRTAEMIPRGACRLSIDGPTTGWLLELSEILARRGRPPWTTFIRADQVAPEVAWGLAAGGCCIAAIGAEYLSDSVLERLGKGFKVADVLAAHSHLVDAGIEPFLCFMDLDEFVSPEEVAEHHQALQAFGALDDHATLPRRPGWQVRTATCCPTQVGWVLSGGGNR